MIFYRFLPHRFPVHKEFHFGQIGIYLDGQCHGDISLLYPTPVFPVTTGDMQYRNIFPPGSLIVKIDIFGSTVCIDQSLIVDARHRFVTQSGREINEIPMSTSANVGSFLQHRQVMFQINLLVFTAEIKSAGLQGMQPFIGTRSIFADNKRMVRIVSLLLCQIMLKSRQISTIPTRI